MSTPEITAKALVVKELRERTGAGMSDCKKALDATSGDIEAAAEKLRMDGSAKADKKAGRTAAEGVVAIASNSEAVAVVELNLRNRLRRQGLRLPGALASNAVAAGRPGAHRPGQPPGHVWKPCWRLKVGDKTARR